MTGNPWADRAPFYTLMWTDLRAQMPFATNMQLFEAGEILTNILNTVFTQQARKLAYDFEARQQQAQDTQTHADHSN